MADWKDQGTQRFIDRGSATGKTNRWIKGSGSDNEMVSEEAVEQKIRLIRLVLIV